MLLMELTLNYSDLDRLKYLNIILMTEFKNLVQRKEEQIQGDENSSLDQDMDHTLVRCRFCLGLEICYPPYTSLGLVSVSSTLVPSNPGTQ